MGFELSDRFETTDGSRPEAAVLDEAAVRRIPLAAFTVLAGGDAFEGGGAPQDGPARARAYIASHFVIEGHGAPPALVDLVRNEAITQLSGNPGIAARLTLNRQIIVDLIPPGDAMARYGYPPQVSAQASGLFWDHPSWPFARMALRQDALEREDVLVTHELAHAIHYMAFSKAERELIYSVLRPSFGSRAAMDEVFAIYSEREFLPQFSDTEKRAPGVYGFTRRQWDEDHVFTRFVRKLYFPYKKLAGQKMTARADQWSKFMGR